MDEYEEEVDHPPLHENTDVSDDFPGRSQGTERRRGNYKSAERNREDGHWRSKRSAMIDSAWRT